MKRKLAIIGANEAISILIQKAKDMDFETHVLLGNVVIPEKK